MAGAVRMAGVERMAGGGAELRAEQLAGCHGALVLSPRVTASSLQAADDLLAIARFGVGYDSVDVPPSSRGADAAEAPFPW